MKPAHKALLDVGLGVITTAGVMVIIWVAVPDKLIPPEITTKSLSYEGHTYLIFSEGSANLGILHNPECRKCKSRGAFPRDSLVNPEVKFFEYRTGVDDKKTGDGSEVRATNGLY